MRARLLLPAAALTAFGGSLVAGFHLDDYAIFSDPLPRALGWPHPLTHLIDWLNYRVAGQEPLGYHAVNLLLHLGAVLLAYECLRRLLPATAAVIAAAIFAVHPLQTEAVDYVAARGVTIAAVLCFAALLAWIEGQPWVAVAAFGAALLADERCALFPLVLLMVRPAEHGPNASGQGSAGGTACATQADSVFPVVGQPVPPASLLLPVALSLALATAVLLRVHMENYAFALVGLRFLRLFVVPWGFTIAPDIHEPLWLAIAAVVAVVAVAVWRRRQLSVHSEWTWLLAGLLLLIPGFSANPATDPRAYLPLFAFAAAVNQARIFQGLDEFLGSGHGQFRQHAQILPDLGRRQSFAIQGKMNCRFFQLVGHVVGRDQQIEKKFAGLVLAHAFAHGSGGQCRSQLPPASGADSYRTSLAGA